MAIQSLYEIVHWNATIIDESPDPDTVVLPKGVITDLTLPNLERDMDTTKRAGELGIVPRPKFFNEMEMSFTAKATFLEMMTHLTKGMARSITLKATACLEADDNTVKSYIVEGKGFVSSLPLGSLTADGLEAEVTMMLYYLKMNLDTLEVIYDPRNYVYSVGGTNLFTDIAAIIDPA